MSVVEYVTISPLVDLALVLENQLNIRHCYLDNHTIGGRDCSRLSQEVLDSVYSLLDPSNLSTVHTINSLDICGIHPPFKHRSQVQVFRDQSDIVIVGRSDFYAQIIFGPQAEGLARHLPNILQISPSSFIPRQYNGISF